jgi:creatinine amidohydrolase/Fe(II)-dependent formamide hydrolase-like protein
MPSRPPSRVIGELTSPEAARCVATASTLCLPIGAIEQHGAHLPLSTDVVVAEELARRIVERWGEELDLWLLPTIAISVSREHDWAPGTLCLSLTGFSALLRELARELVQALPARNLLIVNGHGGNRGILDNLILELRGELGLNSCVIHPFDLSTVTLPASIPDVHGGLGETAVMLALAPHLVRRDLIGTGPAPDRQEVDALILDRGVTYAWRSDDPRLTRTGAIGEAAAATAELGRAIIDSVVAETGGVLQRLRRNRDVAVLPRPFR